MLTVHGDVAHENADADRVVLPAVGHVRRAVPWAVKPCGHDRSHDDPAAMDGWHALTTTLLPIVAAFTVHGPVARERFVYVVQGLGSAPLGDRETQWHTSEALEGAGVQLNPAGPRARQLCGRAAVWSEEAIIARQPAHAVDPHQGASHRCHVGLQRRCVERARCCNRKESALLQLTATRVCVGQWTHTRNTAEWRVHCGARHCAPDGRVPVGHQRRGASEVACRIKRYGRTRRRHNDVAADIPQSAWAWAEEIQEVD